METREVQSCVKASSRSQPTTSFYLSVDAYLYLFTFSHACLLNKYLKCPTDSQVCLSIVTCGVSGGKMFSLDKCTKLDIFQQCGWFKLLYRVFPLEIVGLGGILLPSFKNLVIGVYFWKTCSFLCSFSGSQQCLVGIILDRLLNLSSVQFSHSVVSDSVTPWTAACQAFLSITMSRSLLKLMSINSVMPSKHLILCHPLLLLPSIFPSIRVFSNESVLHIRWPK